MKKSYKVTGIDCANCAAKLEEKLQKINGVEKLSLNFMTQKLTLTAADENFGTVLEEVVKCQKEYEPDWKIEL